MSNIGTFPGLSGSRKVVHRIQSNPLDKTTIVSIYPKEIVEIKPSIFPGKFIIPAAPRDGFSLTLVKPSSWFKEQEEGMPDLEIPSNSVMMADSIIRDYCNGLVGCTVPNIMPGLFYIPGEHKKDTITTYVDADGVTFAALLKQARTGQRNYLEELIRMADILWARTNGNPLSITDDSRMAAEILGLKDKPWLQDYNQLQMVNCPMCGNVVNPSYAVCANCKHIINKQAYDALTSVTIPVSKEVK